jgi:DNA-binding transcriptional MerR regulator
MEKVKTNTEKPPENRIGTCGAENCRSINEVARMFGVNEWTIRLWIDRFEILKPRRDAGDKLYFSPTDVKRIKLIHDLTTIKDITLEDVRKHLENNG